MSVKECGSYEDVKSACDKFLKSVDAAVGALSAHKTENKDEADKIKARIEVLRSTSGRANSFLNGADLAFKFAPQMRKNKLRWFYNETEDGAVNGICVWRCPHIPITLT